MEFHRKMAILNLIHQNKHTLFGKYTHEVTSDLRVDKWKEINAKTKFLGIYDKDWRYLRDTTWQNWRKRTVMKRKHCNSLNANGEKRFKYDESDLLIFQILNLEDKGISNDSEMSDVTTKQEVETDPFPHIIEASYNNTEVEVIPNYSSSIIKKQTEKRNANSIFEDLKQQKLKAEIKLLKVKTDIARKERYKFDLEITKLEKEMNVDNSNVFIVPYNQETLTSDGES